MKNQHNRKRIILTIITCLIFALFAAGCSDDQEKKTAVTKKNAHDPFDHTHDVEVTDVEKHKFEHDFAQQCVQRELEKSTNKAFDEDRWKKPCMCIATYLMKDLSAAEAEKFINEHKSTQSLVIKFESAAFHCLQAQAQPAGPKLFGKQ
jgi:PBP1b-binding outer membrane lipoprotein LpoB